MSFPPNQFFRPFIILLSLLLFNSCKNDSGGAHQNLEGAGMLLQEISTFQDENELLITYHLADNSDWMLIKDKLLHERNVLLKQYPNIKSLALICYGSVAHTPIVTSNPTFAWNHEFDAYRLCSLDNNHGFWRYCYGGTLDEPGKRGDWKHIMPLE